MKSKVKRGSLRTISFVLSVVILITSIGLASLITANAYSKLTFYYKLGSGSWTSSEVTLTSNLGTVDVTVSAGTTMYSVIKTDNNEWYGNQTLTVGGTNYLSSLSSNYNYTSGGNNNTFTPSASGTYTFTLDMGSKKISVSGSSGGGGDEPTDSNYYIVGRFGVHTVTGGEKSVGNASSRSTGWSDTSTNIAFQTTDEDGVYVLHTYSTLAYLSENLSWQDWAEPIFFIYDGSKYYQPTTSTTVDAAFTTTYSLTQYSSKQDPTLRFSGSDTTKYVDIYFDTNNGYKLYYKLVDPSYSYYMEGRLNFAWKQTSTDYPFEATDTDNLFVYHTNLTEAELASTYTDGGSGQTRYFFLGRKKEGSTEFKYIHTSGSGDNNVEVSSPYSTTYSAQINDNYNDNNFWHFTGSDSTHYVDIYYDAANNNIYYKLVDVPFNYYIEGRFKVRDYEGTETSIGESGGWAATSKSIPFSATTTEGLYVLKTYSTISELEADVGSSGDTVPYFYIGEALGDKDPSVYYHPTTNDNYSISASNAGTPIATNTTNTTKNFNFHKSSSWTETGQYVVLYLDTSGETPQLYFEFEDPSYNYYLEGRMEVYDSSERDDDEKTSIDWKHDSTDLKFVSTSTSGLYKLETYKTVAELTGHNYYFVLGRGTRSNAPTTFFRPYSDKTLKASDANKKIEGQWTGSWTNFAGYHCIFNDSSSTNSDALVTFYYNENSGQFYFMLTEQEYDTTIYVVNNTNWGTPKVYFYGNSTDGSLGQYGGQLLSGASSYGNYNITKSGKTTTIKFNKGANDINVIFNDNSSNSTKTPDNVAIENGKTYVINGTDSLTVIDGQVVSFIAKDGMIRDDSHKSFGEYATTTVTAVANQVIVSGTTTEYSNTKYVTGTAVKGKDITVSTTINDTYKGKYYVAGFSFNGVTPQILTENTDSSGVYSCTYTIPEDFAYDTLEITPIYFLKSAYSANYVTFNISGYESVKNEGWGSTLYIYPFYVDYTNATNYGTYPGQPVINYGGQLYTQIPTTDTGEASGNAVKGVTISNGYWDLKHRDVEGWPNDSAYHHQTYDFDDFYKLYKENGSNLNSIFFTFKYEEAQAHRTTVPTSHVSTNASDYRNDDIANTLTQAQMDAYNAANGFEDYKNANGKLIDLFGTVLTGSGLTADPIYVISQGYEYNNSGSFATEWDVFYWDSTNNRYQKVVESGGKNFTSIVPSVLHIKDYEHISTNYPAADGDLSVSDYEGIYRALEPYAERPVKICYEQDIMAGHFNRNKNNESGYDQAYRCDGVWSYTLKTDFVAANTLIEYSDDNGASWYEDAFNGATSAGTNTKCKAYFTYLNETKNGYTSANDGATAISNVLVDDSKYFTFKAESAGQYEFVGWTPRDSAGNESSISYDSEYAAETKMSSTVTLVARFKKVSSGSLFVSHTIDSSSEGLGDVYLGIRILASDGTTEKAVIADATTNTSAKTIGKQYITSDSTDKIEVTLKTVRRGENTFDKFQLSKDGAEAIDSDATFLPASGATTSDGTTTQTITFDIGSLFKGTDQDIISLAYYSVLNETLNKYEVTFNYKDRDDADKSMLIKGTFTQNQMKNYVIGTGISKTVATGFYDEIKPDVSNFKTDITFDFNTVTPTWAGPTDNAYTMTATVNSTLSNTLDRTVTFVTPFNMTNFVAVDNNGVYNYLAEPFETEPLTVEYGKLIKLSNGSVDLENGSFVTAPATLVETVNGEVVVHYFKCWTIKTLSGATVASCYYPEFNYLTYDNSIIEAEYSTDTTKYYEYFNTAQAVTATFLKNTRTQWNVSGQGDLIYSDFALAFKYKDVKFYENGWSNKYEAGVVMQRLDAVDLDSDGQHTKTLAQYASKYAGTLTTDQTNIVNYIKSGTAVSGISTRKTEFNYTKFDNKNRLEYFVGMYNSKSWNEAEQAWEYSQWDKDESEWTTADGLNTNSKYVYRLFTYVYDKDNNIVVLSAPAYFYLYNTVN